MSSVYDLRTLTSPAEGSSVKFPAAPYANAASYFDAYAEEISRAAKTIDPAMLDRAAAILLEAYGPDHQELIKTLMNLGILQRRKITSYLISRALASRIMRPNPEDRQVKPAA